MPWKWVAIRLADQPIRIGERRPVGELPGRRVVVDQIALGERLAGLDEAGIAAADRVARAAVVPDAVGRVVVEPG